MCPMSEQYEDCTSDCKTLSTAVELAFTGDTFWVGGAGALVGSAFPPLNAAPFGVAGAGDRTCAGVSDEDRSRESLCSMVALVGKMREHYCDNPPKM